MPDPANDPIPDAVPIEARLRRLEESQGFLERQVEQLNDELARSSRLLAELTARLARIESGSAAIPPPAPEPATLVQAERRAIADALARAPGGLDHAALLLDIDRATLERKLIQHGLA